MGMGGIGRSGPPNDQRRRHVLTLRRQGWTLAEIADELGITYQGVSHYLEEGGLTVRVPIVCATCQRTIATGNANPVREQRPDLVASLRPLSPRRLGDVPARLVRGKQN
jgi:hypothetical protein